MGVEKSEIKISVAHELGCNFDDELEKAERDTLRWSGGARSLKEAAIAIEALLAHIAKDFKSATITNEQADVAVLYVKRATEICRNLTLKSEVMEQRAFGKADALRVVIKTTRSLVDTEQKKIDALLSDEPGPRVVGEHPGQSLASIRREEDSSGSENEG